MKVISPQKAGAKRAHVLRRHVKHGANPLHKGQRIVLEFGDLAVEANRIAYIEAMIFTA